MKKTPDKGEKKDPSQRGRLDPSKGDPKADRSPDSSSHVSRLTPHETGCRINTFFTQQGIGFHREADRWIEAGRVTINGRVARLGDRVVPGDVVRRDGMVLPWGNKRVYMKFHKPLGVTTTCELDVPDNIIAYIGHAQRIFPIGRLDKDSSGLMILLTNDGEIVNQILRAEHGHEKEYLVQVDRLFDQDVPGPHGGGHGHPRPEDETLHGQPARSAGIPHHPYGRPEPADPPHVRGPGLSRDGAPRVRVMNITIEGLAVGQCEVLSDCEREELFAALRRSARREAGT